MLLVVDIGNTNIVLGVFDKADLAYEFRIKSDPAKTVDEYGATVLSLLSIKMSSDEKILGAIVSSVVPSLTHVILEMISSHLEVKTIVVGPGIKTGVPVKTEDPKSVGSDRIVNAVAAKTLYGVPALVVDFGTATTFDYIGKDGSYEGGAIAPGLALSVSALVENTAKLPQIELEWPKSAVGKTTVTAMQSGAVIGYVGLVDGLIRKIIEEKGEISHIIATGGNGEMMAKHSALITSYDPTLTLHGLRILYEMNVA
ncbi:MAG: type III pantothenate kinase [Candidatus Dadabacteria bacterium]|nr:MAG: type III pantothenate kinase [Candidatus Dadabacteria bacterium]